jgi:molecular chaperone GrpE
MTSPEENEQQTADGQQPDANPFPPTEEAASSPSGGGAAESGGGGQIDPLESAEFLDIEVLEPDVGPTAHELGLELPDDPNEAQDLLLRELSEARQEAGEHLEMLQRVAADFDNFRRRIERDQAENVERASQRVIEGLLPTLDAFDAATASEPQSPSEEKIREGVLSTRSQLLETLAREGFEAIPATGEGFDPRVHEAVSGPGDGDGDLIVGAELRRGYVMRGRVIRPSLVTVEHA